MLRIADFELGQWREPGSINQYQATDAVLREAGLRPDLAPTDTTPMSLEVRMDNPGEVILRATDEITVLQPVGARSVLVYPQVVPTPDITTDISYEDQYPRTQHRPILRGRQGENPYGPFPAPERGKLGQDDVPVTFYYDPAEIAYQTYPGPSLGQSDQVTLRVPQVYRFTPHLLTLTMGAGLAILSLTTMKNGALKQVLSSAGMIAAGVGLAGFLQEIAK